VHGLIKSKATPLSVTKPNYLSHSNWVSLCHNLSDILSHNLYHILSHKISPTLSHSVSRSLWHSLSHIITHKVWRFLSYNARDILSHMLFDMLSHMLFDMLSHILSLFLCLILSHILWHSAMAFRTLLSIPHCNICARDCQGKNQGNGSFAQLLHSAENGGGRKYLGELRLRSRRFSRIPLLFVGECVTLFRFDVYSLPHYFFINSDCT
jgi:hypothetical protein